MRLWIDTDLGSDVDDALALAYALLHPELEVVGVSTVFGDVELRTRIVQALLDLADAGDIPVITGLGKPLTAGRDGLMFGHEGQGILEDASPIARTTENPEAATRIGALADALAATKPEVLVAIGPMTNVGALTEASVSLPPLCIMGGKIEDVMLEGMTAQIPEWNWYCDPRAVQLSLAAIGDTPARIVPAEVTFRTSLADGDVERLATGSPLIQALGVLSKHWLVALVERLGAKSPRVALHDPLAIATLVESSLCPFEPRSIEVDERGGTIHLDSPANAEVATSVDNDALRRHLMDTWIRT